MVGVGVVVSAGIKDISVGITVGDGVSSITRVADGTDDGDISAEVNAVVGVFTKGEIKEDNRSKLLIAKNTAAITRSIEIKTSLVCLHTG